MLTRVIVVIVTLLYPLAVYYGLQVVDPRQLIGLLLAVAAIRLLSLGQSPLNHWLWLPALGILALWSWLDNSALGIKLYPVLVSGSMLLLFGWSLWRPPSMIERFARIKEPDLSPRAVAYTRAVTKCWCMFFFSNGSIALLLTLFGSDAQWALYNGVIAYLAMAVLFAAEWLFRQRVMKAEHD